MFTGRCLGRRSLDQMMAKWISVLTRDGWGSRLYIRKKIFCYLALSSAKSASSFIGHYPSI